jgi:2'-5' RNA ligase
MRCFIGFELVDTCLERMRQRVEPFCMQLNKELGWRLRLVHPDNWHMTCLFFADLDGAERELVWQEVLRNVTSGVWSDLMVPWRAIELWPEARRPTMIALAAPPFAGAAQWPISARLGDAPLNKGEVAHLQTYRPHITMMRFRGPTRIPYEKEWSRITKHIPIIPPTAVRFDRVSLFLSDVSPTKPVYTREYTANLQ